MKIVDPSTDESSREETSRMNRGKTKAAPIVFTLETTSRISLLWRTYTSLSAHDFSTATPLNIPLHRRGVFQFEEGAAADNRHLGVISGLLS